MFTKLCARAAATGSFIDDEKSGKDIRYIACLPPALKLGLLFSLYLPLLFSEAFYMK